MIKAGAIYSRRGGNRHHTCSEIGVIREKESIFLLKSTSDEVDSRLESVYYENVPSHKENNMRQVNAGLKKGVEAEIEAISPAGIDSFFDSLTQYEKKPATDPNFKAIVSLQLIFKELRVL